jgi:hypothetical protein
LSKFGEWLIWSFSLYFLFDVFTLGVWWAIYRPIYGSSADGGVIAALFFCFLAMVIFVVPSLICFIVYIVKTIRHQQKFSGWTFLYIILFLITPILFYIAFFSPPDWLLF